MKVSKRWWGRGRTAFLTVLAAAAFWTAGRAADKADEAPKSATNAASVVPADAAIVAAFHLSELWDNKDYQASLAKIVKAHPDALEGFDKDLGVQPQDIENIAVVLLGVESRGGPIMVVTTRKPFDAKKIAAALAPAAEKETVKGRTYLNNPNGQSVAFVSDRTYAVGAAEEIKNYLSRPSAAKEGPLTPALSAAGKHCVAIGVNVPLLAETAPKDAPPQMAALLALLKAKTALVTVDLGKDSKAEAKFTFAGEADAEAGENAANAALDLARGRLVMVIGELKKQKGMEAVAALFQEIQTGLRKANVERDGSAVTATMMAKVDLPASAGELAEAVQKVRGSASRMRSVNNLKQLALAMHIYNDSYGNFPADAIYDKNGKPLLSWRVMLLPYVEQNELYKQFHLDEPWDSEHNKKLLEQMPPLFAAGDEQALKNHETHYQGFVGKGAFFDGEKGIPIVGITDGTSNTIMIVEAKKTVPWTKPEDVPFDAGKLVPKLGGVFDDIFNVAFADGSVHSMPLTIAEEKLRALVTRNGGEVVDPNK